MLDLTTTTGLTDNIHFFNNKDKERPIYMGFFNLMDMQAVSTKKEQSLIVNMDLILRYSQINSFIRMTNNENSFVQVKNNKTIKYLFSNQDSNVKKNYELAFKVHDDILILRDTVLEKKDDKQVEVIARRQASDNVHRDPFILFSVVRMLKDPKRNLHRNIDSHIAFHVLFNKFYSYTSDIPF